VLPLKEACSKCKTTLKGYIRERGSTSGQSSKSGRNGNDLLVKVKMLKPIKVVFKEQ